MEDHLRCMDSGFRLDAVSEIQLCEWSFEDNSLAGLRLARNNGRDSKEGIKFLHLCEPCSRVSGIISYDRAVFLEVIGCIVLVFSPKDDLIGVTGCEFQVHTLLLHLAPSLCDKVSTAESLRVLRIHTDPKLINTTRITDCLRWNASIQRRIECKFIHARLQHAKRVLTHIKRRPSTPRSKNHRRHHQCTRPIPMVKSHNFPIRPKKSRIYRKLLQRQ